MNTRSLLCFVGNCSFPVPKRIGGDGTNPYEVSVHLVFTLEEQ